MQGATGAEMTQSAQPPDRKPDEPLTKMSIGDHLDELRRRLMICIGSVGVCVLVMMGFKGWVTEVYIQPYRISWRMAYVDYLEYRDQQFQDAAFSGPSGTWRPAGPVVTMPPAQQQQFLFVQEHKDAIRAGTFPETGRIRTESGFDQAWVAPGQPGRDAWLGAFDTHAQALWDAYHGYGKQNLLEVTYGYWEFNHKYREQVLNGTFPEKAAIKNIGGMTLPWSLLAGSPLQDFWTFMAAAALFGVIISSPILIWQIWSFVAAGLYQKERKIVYRMTDKNDYHLSPTPFIL